MSAAEQMAEVAANYAQAWVETCRENSYLRAELEKKEFRVAFMAIIFGVALVAFTAGMIVIASVK